MTVLLLQADRGDAERQKVGKDVSCPDGQQLIRVAEQGNALWRGIALTRDDCIRRDVIKALICNFSLDFSAVEKQWDLNFSDYFAEDLALLAPLAKDGLVDVDEKGIQVTAKGRLLIRNICMCFDAYLRQKARIQQFSRVI